MMRKLLGVLLLAFAAACSNDSTSPGNGSVAGNYPLRTANGLAIPAIASQDATGTYEVLHGRIVLNSDFSFVDSLTARFTPTGGAPQASVDVRQGTYVQTGNNITLSFINAGSLSTYYVTWIGPNTLVYAEPGLSLIYQK
jgi:hypothetical protein